MHSKYFRVPQSSRLFVSLMALQYNISMARNAALLQTPLKDLASICKPLETVSSQHIIVASNEEA